MGSAQLLQAVLLLFITIGLPSLLPGAQPARFQQLLEAAKKEGELNLWSSTPEEEVAPKLVEALNARFGMEIKVNQVSMDARVFTTRVLAGAQSGRIEADSGQGASDTAFILDENRMLEEFDWVGVFGQEFPAIKRRVEHVADSV